MVLLGFRIWMMAGGQPIFNENELPAMVHPSLLVRTLTFNYYLVVNSGLLLLPNYAGEILAFPYLFVPYDGPRWEWRFALISTLDLAVRARAPAPTFMPAHAIQQPAYHHHMYTGADEDNGIAKM